MIGLGLVSFAFGVALATRYQFLILGVVTFAVGSLPIVIFIGLPIYFFWKRMRRTPSTAFSASEIAKDELGVE